MREVVVVGAGTTGAAVVYHLAKAGVKDILCLEMGKVGRGLDLDFELQSEKLPADPTDNDNSYKPFVSGTAVFEGGDKGPSAIKMIVTAPPYKTVSEFIDHHGIEGVKTYLEATAFGRDLEVGYNS
jgi:NADPH-dependent 2,4-dienoyl-CoA reductase/sulfur reductase-like enzyme